MSYSAIHFGIVTSSSLLYSQRLAPQCLHIVTSIQVRSKLVLSNGCNLFVLYILTGRLIPKCASGFTLVFTVWQDDT